MYYLCLLHTWRPVYACAKDECLIWNCWCRVWKTFFNTRVMSFSYNKSKLSLITTVIYIIVIKTAQTPILFKYLRKSVSHFSRKLGTFADVNAVRIKNHRRLSISLYIYTCVSNFGKSLTHINVETKLWCERMIDTSVIILMTFYFYIFFSFSYRRGEQKTKIPTKKSKRFQVFLRNFH